MKAVKFTYTMEEVLKKVAKSNGISGLRFKDFSHEKDGDKAVNGICVKHKGETHYVYDNELCILFGGVGGTYSHKGYNPPRVKWTGKGEKAKFHVWKKILTIDEFRYVMKRHNVGFGDKGNPKVLRGVVVYSPSASDWKRYLWDCDFKDKAYYCWSNAETYLEKDPSAGLIRHPHCVMESLRGDSRNGGETLIRPNYDWVVDYCYIDGFCEKGE